MWKSDSASPGDLVWNDGALRGASQMPAADQSRPTFEILEHRLTGVVEWPTPNAPNPVRSYLNSA